MARLNVTDLYKEVWEGRNIELTHQWQRSVMLGAIVLIAFTAYFALWNNSYVKENFIPTLISSNTRVERQSNAEIHVAISINSTLNSTASNDNNVMQKNGLKVINSIFLFVVLVGMSFSLLWVCMAKGSKYWYEKYENALTSIYDHHHLILDNELQNLDAIEKLKKNPNYESKQYFPRYGCLPSNFKTRETLIRGNAGAFSVSRVNIAIGQILYVCWTLLYFSHLSLFFFIGDVSQGATIFLFATGFLVWICISVWLQRYLESGESTRKRLKKLNHDIACLTKEDRDEVSRIFKSFLDSEEVKPQRNKYIKSNLRLAPFILGYCNFLSIHCKCLRVKYFMGNEDKQKAAEIVDQLVTCFDSKYNI
ncbi:MAG: hypothetical protein WBI82_10385 [Sphaerochaeta sp.]